MSHFIMICGLRSTSGTPNGQASTQLPHAMQRGLRADLHDAVAGALDRVGRADLGAGRLLAVHADDRHGLHALRAVDVFEVNHRLAAMRVALGARLHARLAADAAVRDR